MTTFPCYMLLFSPRNVQMYFRKYSLNNFHLYLKSVIMYRLTENMSSDGFGGTLASAYAKAKLLGSSHGPGSWYSSVLLSTYGKSNRASNRIQLGRTPFRLKETHCSSLPLNSFTISDHNIYSLIFG